MPTKRAAGLMSFTVHYSTVIAAAGHVPSSSHSHPQRWSVPHRLAFRFVCCYWLLYNLPARGHATILDPLLLLLRGFLGTPAWRTLLKPYFDMWTAVDIWVGTHVFKVPGLGTAHFIPGSETVLEYFHWFTLLVLAGLTTLVWSLLDRRRTNYKELHDWTRILVRYQLAMSLFSYGFMKVFPVQFQTFYGLARLMEPFGEFSRSGVLWNFMAVSIPYTVFSGAAEVAAGFLLLFRRTTTLGALISFPVLLNVVLLNIFYDVGVKISSTHMLLMSVFLLVPVLGRLINVAVLNRAA